jgi:hypothetical protein
MLCWPTAFYVKNTQKGVRSSEKYISGMWFVSRSDMVSSTEAVLLADKGRKPGKGKFADFMFSVLVVLTYVLA